jgi:acetoin utilization deacetylase AcuC-like enzyme
MAAGLPAQRYREALLDAVDAATRGWTPQLVLLSAGFDCLAVDPLGGFTLECGDIVALTEALVERAEQWCDGRLVSALEGGYNPDATAEAAVAHLAALRR